MQDNTARRVATLSRETIASLANCTQTYMRRLSRSIVAVSVSLAVFSGPAAAQETEGPSCGTLPDQLQAIERFLTQLQEVGMAVAFLLAAVMLVYVGLAWMSGRPERQEKARRTFVNVFVGLLIVVLAGGLVEWVKMTICAGGGA